MYSRSRSFMLGSEVSPSIATLLTNEFVYKLIPNITIVDLDYYNELTLIDREEYLNTYEPTELVNALQEIQKEVTNILLENYYLQDFLRKHDDKFYSSTMQRVELIKRRSSKEGAAYTGRTGRAGYDPTFSIFGGSIATMGSVSARKVQNAIPNYTARINMIERICIETDKSIKELITNSKSTIKTLHAHVEEYHYTTEETEILIDNFKLHFLKTERDCQFLENASETQMRYKFLKFTRNWLKNGYGLLDKMRLNLNTVEQHCRQYRSDLVAKSDMKRILSPADYDKLLIKRNELATTFDEVMAHNFGFKKIAGKATLALSEEKKAVLELESKSKNINRQTKEVIKAVEALENEVKSVYNDNCKDMEVLDSLKKQLKLYSAPSVDEYISLKDELVSLEKEEKIWQRKLAVMKIKFGNVVKICKMRKSEALKNAN